MQLATLVRLWLIAVTVMISTAALIAQNQASPQFRTGVTVTRFEATVLEEHTRKPITGLTAADFAVRINGEEQRIVSLAEVKVPGMSASVAAFAEASADVTGNWLQSPRVFVLIMNDAGRGRDPFFRKTAKDIAHRFIDLLGPRDLAAVVFVRDNRHAQDLTTDRTLLRKAVEEFRPFGTPLNPNLVLIRTMTHLQLMKGYRRAIVYVTPMGGNIGERDKHDLIDAFRDLNAVAAGSRSSGIPVYTFSAHGLHPPTAQDIARGHQAFVLYDTHVESLRTIAQLTGGRATVKTNAPVEHVPAMFEELGTYYVLAYEDTSPADGRLRRVDVQVKRPGAIVLSSRLIRAPPAGEAEPGRAGAGRASGLLEALESPLPMGAVPLRLAALPLAVTGAREQAVAVTLGLPPVDTPDQFRVRFLVYDGEGIRQVLDQTRTVDIARGTNGEPTELALRLGLRPGRYNVRVAAERASDNTAGSVHATIVVPDFARDPLSLSGVAIGRGDGRRIVGRAELDGLLPFAPTAARAFERTDQVGALLRVHQPPRRAVDAMLETEILDASGAVVVTASRAIETSVFRTGSAEHRYELPLADLAPGEYLLRFSAAAGTAHAQRDVRFSVR